MSKPKKELMEMFQKVKGTTDYFPEEKAVMNYVFDKLRETAVNYSFQEVDAPALEYFDLLSAKSGDEIRKQIFVMEKKGDEEIGLRFDLTVGIARMFIEKQKSIPKPAKWFYITNMWRYERPQKGRLREFFQFGAELFGTNKPESDAEVISVAIDSLKNLGLKKDDFVVLVNNRRMILGVIKKMLGTGEAKALDVMKIIDGKSKLTEEEFANELKEIKLNNEQIEKLNEVLAIDNLNEIKVLEMDQDAKAAFEEFSQVMEALKSKKQSIRFDPSIVRGLDYYTDTVFEIFDKDRKFRAICGGGRYDKMIAGFGGVPCPAAGFGMGFSTLRLLLEDKGLIPALNEGPDYYVAAVNDGVRAKAFEIASMLRKKNSVEIDLMGKALRKQFDSANTIKAKKVIVVGPDELKDNKVVVKDMITGEEKTVEIDKLIE